MPIDAVIDGHQRIRELSHAHHPNPSSQPSNSKT
jgi:hypothetical protein